jgi:predicted nucleic acid-binding protein
LTAAPATVVIDASVSLAWLLDEPDNSPALRDLFLKAFRRECRVWVPALWHWECANVLLGMVKRAVIQLPEVPGYLELMRYANPEVDAPPSAQIQHACIELAQVTDLSYYDASYVELALRQKTSLATFDEKMKAAAQRLGVFCWDF